MRMPRNWVKPEPVKVKGVTRQVLDGIHEAIKASTTRIDGERHCNVNELLRALVPVLKDANPATDVQRFCIGIADMDIINELVARLEVAPRLKG